jgi:hypothetical protein
MPEKAARVRGVADPDRKGGGGLSLRTLAIASAASLTAAMATSRLFPPGTIYASALTPVIVAAVSEMLHRPAERVSQLARQRRTMVLEARTMEQERILGEEPSPLAGAPAFAQGADAEEELMATSGNGSGDHAPITVHGRRRGGRRVLHPKVWIVTGLVAFTVAVAALTLPELLFGGAVATSKKTTFFGGGSTSSKTHTTTTPTQGQQTNTDATKTVTETQTATTPAPAPTQTDTTTTDTGTETTPSGGAPAPTDSGTSTTPLPSGASTPPTP